MHNTPAHRVTLEEARQNRINSLGIGGTCSVPMNCASSDNLWVNPSSINNTVTALNNEEESKEKKLNENSSNDFYIPPPPTDQYMLAAQYADSFTPNIYYIWLNQNIRLIWKSCPTYAKGLFFENGANGTRILMVDKPHPKAPFFHTNSDLKLLHGIIDHSSIEVYFGISSSEFFPFIIIMPEDIFNDWLNPPFNQTQVQL